MTSFLVIVSQYPVNALTHRLRQECLGPGPSGRVTGSPQMETGWMSRTRSPLRQSYGQSDAVGTLFILSSALIQNYRASPGFSSKEGGRRIPGSKGPDMSDTRTVIPQTHQLGVCFCLLLLMKRRENGKKHCPLRITGLYHVLLRLMSIFKYRINKKNPET